MTSLPQSHAVLRIITLVVLLSSLLAVLSPDAESARALDAAPALTVTAIATTTEQVDLRWAFAPALRPRLAQFQLLRDGVTLASFPAVSHSYLDASVQPSTAYHYTLLAQDASGQVLASWDGPVRTPALPETPDTTPPTPPEDLSAIIADGVVLLDWYYATDDSAVTAYIIQRDGQQLALLPPGSLRYWDATVLPGQTYRYSIAALDSVGHVSSPATAPALRVPDDATPMPAQHATPPTRPGAAPDGASPSVVAGVNAALLRYPYLTDLVGPYVTVNWATDKSAATGSIRWGAVAKNGTCTPDQPVAATPTSIIVNGVGEYQWQAALTLTPDSQYCYRVYLDAIDVLGSNQSPRFRTQLPAGSTTPFSFAVFGDWGAVEDDGSNPDQARLMQRIAASGARFALTTGDNSYPSGSQNNYGDLLQRGPNLSAIFGSSFWPVVGASMPLFPAIGNHGLSRSDTLHPHLVNWPQDRAVTTSGGTYAIETYCCRNGTESESMPSTWYAFDAGTARFYVLHAAWDDVNVGTASDYKNDYDYHWQPSSAEYQWLAQDLAAHPTALKFAFFHYPLYSANSFEISDAFLQGANSLEGLLSRYGVAIAFNGHAHLYQRNRKVNADSLISYITGAGGAKLEPISASCGAAGVYAIGWSYSANGGAGGGSACGNAPVPTSRAQVFHFLLVTVNGTQVTVTPTDSQGNTFDVQTYQFGSLLPTATPTPKAASTPMATSTPPGSTPTVTSTPPGSTDTEPPTPPANLTANHTAADTLVLNWTAATDNVGVTGYRIQRDGQDLSTVDGTTLTYLIAPAPAAPATYTVRAFDAAGNYSLPALVGTSSPASNMSVFVPLVAK